MTCADIRRSALTEHMPSTKDSSHRTTEHVSHMTSHDDHNRLDSALTLTRLLLHSRQPFLDFLWLLLAPESPILVTESLMQDQTWLRVYMYSIRLY